MEEILRLVDSLDSISAKLLLRESYETIYQIYNHEADNRAVAQRPLALVAMHAKEDTSSFSPMYRMWYRYHHFDIERYTHLNLVEFLELPHEYVELAFKLAADVMAKEGPKIDRAARELQRAGAGLAGLGRV